MSLEMWRQDDNESSYAVYVRTSSGYHCARKAEEMSGFDDAVEWFDYETDMAQHSVSTGAANGPITVELLRDGNHIVKQASVELALNVAVRREQTLTPPERPRNPPRTRPVLTWPTKKERA